MKTALALIPNLPAGPIRKHYIATIERSADLLNIAELAEPLEDDLAAQLLKKDANRARFAATHTTSPQVIADRLAVEKRVTVRAELLSNKHTDVDTLVRYLDELMDDRRYTVVDRLVETVPLHRWTELGLDTNPRWLRGKAAEVILASGDAQWVRKLLCSPSINTHTMGEIDHPAVFETIIEHWDEIVAADNGPDIFPKLFQCKEATDQWLAAFETASATKACTRWLEEDLANDVLWALARTQTLHVSDAAFARLVASDSAASAVVALQVAWDSDRKIACLDQLEQFGCRDIAQLTEYAPAWKKVPLVVIEHARSIGLDLSRLEQHRKALTATEYVQRLSYEGLKDYLQGLGPAFVPRDCQSVRWAAVHHPQVFTQLNRNHLVAREQGTDEPFILTSAHAAGSARMACDHMWSLREQAATVMVTLLDKDDPELWHVALDRLNDDEPLDEVSLYALCQQAYTAVGRTMPATWLDLDWDHPAPTEQAPSA